MSFFLRDYFINKLNLDSIFFSGKIYSKSDPSYFINFLSRIGFVIKRNSKYMRTILYSGFVFLVFFQLS